jgi:argininosuccinate synthase
MSKGTVTLIVEEYERLRDIERSIDEKPCVIVRDSNLLGVSYEGYDLDELNKELLKELNKHSGKAKKAVYEARELKREIDRLKHTASIVNERVKEMEKQSLWKMIVKWLKR